MKARSFTDIAPVSCHFGERPLLDSIGILFKRVKHERQPSWASLNNKVASFRQNAALQRFVSRLLCCFSA